MANYKKWTEAEINFIRDHITNMNDTEMGLRLSSMTGETITSSMIRRQRRKLGVTKKRGRPKKTSTENNIG